MEALHYNDYLAMAIANAPSKEEALRLMEGGHHAGPSLIKVLGGCIAAHNEAAILACHEKLDGRTLTPSEQGEAILDLKRSPTANRLHSEEEERNIATLIVRLGLLTGSALTPHGTPLGPLTYLINHFREHAAQAILPLITPTPEDMAGALVHCAAKLSAGARRDQDKWIQITEALFQMGGDPNLVVPFKNSNTISAVPHMSSACSQLMSAPRNWHQVPFENVAAFLGRERDTWTQEDVGGHSLLSRWIRSGGDISLGVYLGKDQSLTLSALEGVMRAGIDTSSPQGPFKANIWQVFDGAIKIEPTTFDPLMRALARILASGITFPHNSNKARSLSSFLEEAEVHFSSLLNGPDQMMAKRCLAGLKDNLPKAWRDMQAPKGEEAQNEVIKIIDTLIDANTLDKETPKVQQSRRSARL